MNPRYRQSVIIVGALVLTLAGSLASAEAAAPLTDGLVAAVQERLLAFSQGDKKTWSRLTAEDAFFVTDTGTFLGKTAMEKSFPPAYPDVFSDVQDVVMRECGTGVVVSYVAR